MSQETTAAELVARVRADISQYEREMSKANRTMNSTARNMERQAGGAARNTSRGMDLLGKAVAGVFTVAAMRKIVNYADKLAVLNERVVQVTGNYARMLDGGSVSGGLRELREATGGGADNLFLMEASSRLMAVHLADSNQEAAELLRISAQLGKFSKGYTVEQSVENLLPLLSNQSALRLDEFGLSGDRVQKLAQKYEDAGMESGAAFKRAFMEEAAATLEAIGAQVVTETEKLAAARANLQAGFAAAAGEGMFGQIYDLGRGLLTEGMGAAGDYFQRIADTRAQLAEFTAQMRQMEDQGVLTGASYSDLFVRINDLSTAAAWGTISQEEMAAALERAKSLTPGVAAAYAAWAVQIHGVDSAVDSVQARLEQLAGRTYIAELEVQIRQNYMGNAPYLAALAGQEQKTAPGGRWDVQSGMSRTRQWEEQWQARQDDNAAMEEYNYLIADQAGKLSILDDRLAEVAQGSAEWYAIQSDIWQLTQGSTKKGGGGGGISDYTRQLREYESELRSAASAAFATSSVTQRDWWETNTGQYKDKPDEYLRRLRSAMTDPASQWQGLLGGRSGDEAELYAAQQEELWRSGQWSQMGPGFDAEGSRTAMIDQIIQRVNADRSRAAMIEGLIRDPRLQGLGMSASELTAATGTPMAAAGVEQMNVMVKAAGSVNAGQQMAESIDAQFRSTEDLWVAMGESAMRWFTGGFTTLAPEIATALARTLLGPLLDEMERQGVRSRP